jgi:hypothetical protein
VLSSALVSAIGQLLSSLRRGSSVIAAATSTPTSTYRANLFREQPGEVIPPTLVDQHRHARRGLDAVRALVGHTDTFSATAGSNKR